MSTIITYKRLQVVDPTPTGDGGEALNEDFQTIDDLVIFNQGAYGTGPTYYPNDLVLYSNTYYLCLNENTNDYPPSANWQYFGSRVPPTLESVTQAGASTDQAISIANVLQLTPPGSTPAPVAGGIYFDGTHFYASTNGTSWTVLL